MPSHLSGVIRICWFQIGRIYASRISVFVTVRTSWLEVLVGVAERFQMDGLSMAARSVNTHTTNTFNIARAIGSVVSVCTNQGSVL